MIGAWIAGGRNGRKPELRHALDQRRAVRRVAREPRRLPALGERAGRAPRRTRRRRASAACSATASSSPCTSTGRGGRAPATSSCRRQRSSASRRAMTKPMPGGPSTHLPDAAISASNGVVRGVDRQRRERAHRVDDQPAAVARHDRGDLGQRVEDARRRLAVDQPDVGDRRVGGEQPVDVLRRRRHVVGGLEGRQPAAHHLRELRHPRAVGAVDQHQQVAVARHQRVDRRLDRERAAALHRHADVRVRRRATSDEQLAPDVGGHRVERRRPTSPSRAASPPWSAATWSAGRA